MRQKTSKDSTKKEKRKITVITFFQSLYFSLSFFVKNDLLSYASACAFGFLFSFIPVVMLILIFLIRIVHASPDTVFSILETFGVDTDMYNWKSALDSILNIQHITNFEVVSVIAIFLMARRFFSSTMSGLGCVFQRQVPIKPLISQIFIFAGEAILIVAISIVISAIIAFRTVHAFPIFEVLINRFPGLLGKSTTRLVNIIPQVFIFLAVTVTYKFATRSNPKLSSSMLCAAGCTLSFWVFQKIMNVFINVNRYNLVYGVLSNTIVLLLEVWFFFIFFLFFAQDLFVKQYFDTLVLSELYILPDRENTAFYATFKRLLFIRPDSLLLNKKYVTKYPKGTYIYCENDPGTDAYYIVNGTVELSRINNITFLDRGKFFGEQACLLNEIRIDTARAYTDVEIVRINEDEFFSILEKNPKVNKAALSQISNYFSKFYGRSDKYPL